MGGLCSETIAAGSSALLERMRLSSVKAGPMLPLTKDKFELLTFAAEMNIAVSFPNCENEYGTESNPLCYQAWYGDEVAYHEDPTGVDAIMLLDVGDYCFVAWRGSVAPGFNAISLEDWLFRNLDVEDRTAERLDGQGQCTVLEGMYESYQGGELQEAELEPTMISFVETCMAEPNKQLVLTGHSQGAGAAVVGAIRFAGYTPLTLALAGPATVKSPSSDCTAINPDHMWRVINSEISLETNEITYDVVPYSMLVPVARVFLGEQIGASIHLPPDIPNPTVMEDPMATPISFSQDQYDVAYFSKEQIDLEETYGPSPGDLDMLNGVNLGVHIMYLPKMDRLWKNGSFPLDVTGYVPGTPCTGDAECQFMCISRVCALEGARRLPDGTVCEQDSDCESDRCTWGYTCDAKLENGAPCGAFYLNDGDCASGACSFSWQDGWLCAPSVGGDLQTN